MEALKNAVERAGLKTAFPSGLIDSDCAVECLEGCQVMCIYFTIPDE